MGLIPVRESDYVSLFLDLILIKFLMQISNISFSGTGRGIWYSRVGPLQMGTENSVGRRPSIHNVLFLGRLRACRPPHVAIRGPLFTCSSNVTPPSCLSSTVRTSEGVL